MILIVIPNWNNWEITKEAVESVLRSDYHGDYQVVVVDNNSKTIRGSDRGVVLSLNKNVGYAGAVNAAVHNFFGEYVWILNNDVIVGKETLRRLVDTARKGYDVVGSQVMNWGSNVIQKSYAEIGEDLELKNKITLTSKDVHATAFCAVLVRRSVLDKMGGLSEDYFHYFEDNDFFIRARRMGVKMRFVASAKVWHRGGASMGEGGMRWYYMTRNKQILLHKFGKVNHFANMKFFLSCRNWFVRKGIVDYYLHKWGNQQ